MITLTAPQKLTLGVLGAAFLSLGNGAVAQALTFTDRSTFEAATIQSTLKTVNFDDVVLPASGFSFQNPYTRNGATFSDSTKGLQFILSKDYVDSQGRPVNLFSSNFLSENGINSVANITFDKPITAVGFDIGSINQFADSNQTASFFVSTSIGSNAIALQTVQLKFREIQFLGFAFEKPITSLLIAPGSGIGGPQLDNFSFGQAIQPPPDPSPAPPPTKPVPSPALLPGLIGLGLSVWRKRKLAAVFQVAD